MNVLVFSDSHGKAGNIKRALERQLTQPCAVIFLGDGSRDFEYLDINAPTYAVRGNCDAWSMGVSDAPYEMLITLGGKRIFITHGHNYGVKSTLSPLIRRAAELDADIALFGHTHMPFEMRVDVDNEYGISLSRPLLLMNPGSIGSYPYYFGCISISPGGEVLLSHGDLS